MNASQVRRLADGLANAVAVGEGRASVGKAVAQGAAVPQHQHQTVLLAGAQQDPTGQGRQL